MATTIPMTTAMILDDEEDIPSRPSTNETENPVSLSSMQTSHPGSSYFAQFNELQEPTTTTTPTSTTVVVPPTLASLVTLAPPLGSGFDQQQPQPVSRSISLDSLGPLPPPLPPTPGTDGSSDDRASLRPSFSFDMTGRNSDFGRVISPSSSNIFVPPPLSPVLPPLARSRQSVRMSTALTLDQDESPHVAFEQMLEEELLKINTFYSKMEERFSKRHLVLMERVKQMVSCLMNIG